MNQEEIIIDACTSMEVAHFYVGENIPTKKLNRAVKEMDIPNDEQLIALIDCTILGSAKYGAVFTSTGIYVKNDWTSDVREGYLDWESIVDADLMYTDKFGKQEIWINNLHIQMSGSSLSPKHVNDVIAYIQEKLGAIYQHQNISTLQPPPSADLPTHEQWMVTKQGERYGPYDTNTVGQMLMNGQLQAERDYIWKQGMTEWIHIHESETFQKYIVPPLPLSTTKEPETNPVTMDEPNDKIDMNHATLAELLTLPYFTLQKANEFLLKREDMGRFQKIEEVQQVIQIQPHQFEELKQFIFIDSPPKKVRFGRTIDY